MASETEGDISTPPTSSKRAPWHLLDIDVQYQIILDIEAGIKPTTDICTDYNISWSQLNRIRKNREKIKVNVSEASRGGKRKKMMDEAPPTLFPQTTLPEENYNRPRARGRPRRVSSTNANFTATPTSGTSLTIRAINPNGGSIAFPSPNPTVLTPSHSQSSSTPRGKSTGGSGRKYNTKAKSAKAAAALNTVNAETGEIEEAPLRTTGTPLRPSGKNADWDKFLEDGKHLYFIPPVSYFKHAPLSDVWTEFSAIGRVFEVPNPFVRCSRPVNWIAKLVHFAGYKALVEFECLGVSPKHMAWMSYCSDIPKPIGYSDKNRIVLHPPHDVRAEYPDFLARAREVIWNGPRVTVSDDHGEQVFKMIKKCQKYPLNTKLEVLDKDKISRMRIATVTALVGDRIHVTYVIEPRNNDAGFWFNVNSELIHPIGWSQTVEHEIYGVPKSAKFTPLPKDYFPKYPDDLRVERGQVLEVRHPAQPNSICAAVIHRVLKHGYFVIEIRVLSEEVKNPTKFTYHLSSPYIYYCGFCEKHGIKILPPFGESLHAFSWDDYIRRHNVKKAPLDSLPKRPPHKFKAGMKMEGIDIVQPSYLGPCTIIKVAEHMLYIHYDGWKRECPIDKAEAWVDAESPDIYPIGFGELVGHEFLGHVEELTREELANFPIAPAGENEMNIEEETDGDDASTID